MTEAASQTVIHERFVEIAAELSPTLADAITQVGPVELRANDSRPLADHLCRSIAGQQLSVKAAGSIWGRVRAAADGTPLTEFFVETNAEVVRACGLSGAKVRALCGIASQARAGELEAAALSDLDYVERSKRLTALWGVGQWTADMISMFYFGEKDIWPDGDVAARKTLERLTSRRRKTARTAARFAPYRSYLAIYMWNHLDAVPVV